ncbi:NADPH-dependent F420 reductase [Ornithinimicrobium cerasi]|uniref:NADPH-dependent F420 reductase n=1 Tax=Ornithinimicrobium cerasi TaxID=2248773 RepID=UPI000EFDF860|nr:NAD(P)-binding domain-containing protein [Ornithinimicrobium cerasi]
MSNVTIIGTGNMAQAIAGIVTRGGGSAQLLGTEDQGSAVTGEIVVLAVPFPAVREVIAQRPGQLDGRIVVDITNPLNFETFDSLVVPADSSAAQEIAAQLPSSTVLKAFNTTFAATLAGSVGPLTTTVLIAGDDTAAKEQLAAVVRAGGLTAIDAGALKRARELEAVGFLQLTLAATEKISWTGGFGVVA